VNGLISIIITTYNRPDALDAALRALANQSDQNFEIVIADDGSGPDTASIIESWALRLTIPVKHVWQKHQSFRCAESRNRGINASAGAYCIFLDGDCLAPADFVANHRRLAEPGWFVAGNRILLSAQLTNAVLVESLPAETWRFAKLVRQRLRGGVNRLLPSLRVPFGPLRKIYWQSWKGAKTCNLAVARSDLERTDGFDMNYSGWGFEDSDFVVRLLRAGIRRKDGRFATGVLHLWHPESDRSSLQENQSRLDEVLASDRIVPERGLSCLCQEIERPISDRRVDQPERFAARVIEHAN
jgi:glycosyltransferase involved in cell wall biosynthesis